MSTDEFAIPRRALRARPNGRNLSRKRATMATSKKTVTRTGATKATAADQPAVSPVARVVRTGSQATSGALLTGVLAAFVDLSSIQVLAISAALTAGLSWAQNLAEKKGWIPTLTVKPSDD